MALLFSPSILEIASIVGLLSKERYSFAISLENIFSYKGSLSVSMIFMPLRRAFIREKPRDGSFFPPRMLFFGDKTVIPLDARARAFLKLRSSSSALTSLREDKTMP